MERVERKLAAILSADVKGYSRLMGDDEVATIRMLTVYREVLTTLIGQYRGRVVDTPGDNLLADRSEEAILAFQRLLLRNPDHQRGHFSQHPEDRFRLTNDRHPE